ncbi:anoh-2, partial [Pristionchus pacificus]|uniref:Anoctamin n=1 Tax=Pristionchus pacificus TaxID=54126 RepID=A0A8R1UIY7_PRIPA
SGSLGLMLRENLSWFINNGYSEGQRMAISSDLWRYAADSSSPSDLLLTLQTGETTSSEKRKTTVTWLVDVIKTHEPSLHIEVRHHRLNDCYALYLSADYKTLLKGAELCHIKKTLKPSFGGGTRVFSFEDAASFIGVDDRNSFLSPLERATIVKQMLDLIRSPKGGLKLILGDEVIEIVEGRAIVPTLLTRRIITSLLPLHDSDTLVDLRTSWVFTLWGDQPLQLIRSYFGSEIALYFAWLDHMTKALWFPALLGVLMFFFGGWSYRSHDEEMDDTSQFYSDVCFVLFALFNCVWSTIYLEHWKRRQAELAFTWGTYLSNADTEAYLRDPRPAFKGEGLAPNPVTGRMEPFYPDWKKSLIRYCIAYPATGLCVIFLFGVMLATFRAQDTMDYYFGDSFLFSWMCYLPMVFYALFIQLSEKVYREIAFKLNDIENYRTDEDYENFLITKVVLFQFVSAFGTLFYTAFVLKDLRKLQETLATLLITRQITQNISETVVPFLMGKIKLSRMTYKMTRSMSDASLRRYANEVRTRKRSESRSSSSSPLIEYTGRSSRTSNDSPDFSRPSLRSRFEKGVNQLVDKVSVSPLESPSSPRLPIPEFSLANEGSFDVSQAELECVMPTYDRPLDDYLEMFIQFGYVLLFSPAFPLAALSALLNNKLEVRVDAFKLCNTVQRPFGREARDIGAWQRAMEVLGTMGVIVNCALIGQSGLVKRMLPDLSWGGQILFIVLLEHLILGVKRLIDLAVPDVPEWITIEIAKQEHLRREAFKSNTRLISNEPIRKPSRVSIIEEISPLPKRRSSSTMHRLASFFERKNS